MDNKIVRYSNTPGAIPRGVLAIVLGLIFIIWPQNASRILVQLIGVIFLIFGAVNIINILRLKKKDSESRYNRRITPYAGIAIAVFGLILVVIPATFIQLITVVMGILMIMAALGQFSTIRWRRKFGTIPAALYLVPSLITIAGLLIVFNPFSAVGAAFVLCGITLLFYGITEIFVGSRM